MGSATLSFVAVGLACLAYYIVVSPGLVVAEKYSDSSPIKADTRENNVNNIKTRNYRSLYGLGPKMLQISRSKIPIELDLLVDNDDGLEKTKRFDDYGHLRFGKRAGEDQFDDYGHMRFGRSSGQ